MSNILFVNQNILCILRTICIIGLFSVSSCSAQTKQSNATQETFIRHGIASEHLPGGERAFHVRLPPGYFKNTEKTYPVLFHLIASREHITVTQETVYALVEAGDIPEMIIVHLHHDPRNAADIQPTFDGTQGQADAYLDYLETEVLPLLAVEYRVSDDLIFAGWSEFGIIATYALTQRPDTFSGYIIRSAEPEQFFSNLLAGMEAMFSENDALDATLYLATGSDDASPGSQDMVRSFTTLLEGSAAHGLHWETRIFEGTNKNGTYESGLREGLLFYFRQE